MCLCPTEVANAGSSCFLPEGQIRDLGETALKSEVIRFTLLHGAECSLMIVLETHITNLDHFKEEDKY